MQEFHFKTTVGDDGTVTVAGLPFQAGQEVEVTVASGESAHHNGERYPLRGSVISYLDPFESVVQDAWESVK